MIFMPEVLTILILNVIFTFFALIAFVLSVKIYRNWDLTSTCQNQYKLEKQSFLTATIIKYIFAIKLPLFIFFIFTLDKIFHVLSGAMCAAGVVDATEYGSYLLILKLINLYLFAYWLALHNVDIKEENQPYTKLKFAVFIVAFFLLMTEIVLEGLMFGAIDIDKMLSCCGTLYSTTSTSYLSNIFLLKTPLLLSIFYGNFLFIIISYFVKKRYLFAISNFLFIVVSILAIIAFFGTYIYELPTHHCPFCFLQKEYHYVGYLLYIFLFIGTFYGLKVGFIEVTKKEKEQNFTISMFFTTLFVFVLTLYPIVYFIKNGVWL